MHVPLHDALHVGALGRDGVGYALGGQGERELADEFLAMRDLGDGLIDLGRHVRHCEGLAETRGHRAANGLSPRVPCAADASFEVFLVLGC